MTNHCLNSPWSTGLLHTTASPPLQMHPLLLLLPRQSQALAMLLPHFLTHPQIHSLTRPVLFKDPPCSQLPQPPWSTSHYPCCEVCGHDSDKHITLLVWGGNRKCGSISLIRMTLPEAFRVWNAGSHSETGKTLSYEWGQHVTASRVKGQRTGLWWWHYMNLPQARLGLDWSWLCLLSSVQGAGFCDLQVQWLRMLSCFCSGTCECDISGHGYLLPQNMSLQCVLHGFHISLPH